MNTTHLHKCLSQGHCRCSKKTEHATTSGIHATAPAVILDAHAPRGHDEFVAQPTRARLTETTHTRSTAPASMEARARNCGALCAVAGYEYGGRGVGEIGAGRRAGGSWIRGSRLGRSCYSVQRYPRAWPVPDLAWRWGSWAAQARPFSLFVVGISSDRRRNGDNCPRIPWSSRSSPSTPTAAIGKWGHQSCVQVHRWQHRSIAVGGSSTP